MKKLLCLSIVLCACGEVPTGDKNKGVETGNGFADVKMGLTSEDQETITARDKGGTVFTIEKAYTLVDRLTLHRDDVAPIVHNEALVADLVSRTFTPDLEPLSVPAGTFRRVDVRLKFRTGQEPRTEELGDDTFVASGRFTYEDQEYPFELVLRFNAQMSFEGEQGITIDQGATEILPLLLDPAAWFAGLPVTECIQDGLIDLGESPVRLHEGSRRCGNLKPDFARAVRNSGSLKDQ